jgi:hypothetical protein
MYRLESPRLQEAHLERTIIPKMSFPALPIHGLFGFSASWLSGFSAFIPPGFRAFPPSSTYC